jgi:alkaline phosphatase D
MATWDNHDYGSHNGGAEFALKEMTKRLFLDFLGEPSGSERRRRPGVYDAEVFGEVGQRAQIILLDTKTFRGSFKRDDRSAEQLKAIGKVGKYVANDDPDATVLGMKQWAWLERQLQLPADLRLICSSTQVIPDQKGMDEWGVFPREREKLLRILRDRKNVVLLSGNVHFTELSKIRNGSADLFELTSSGMTHFTERYAKAANHYRVAGGNAVKNFGWVEIDWSNGKVVLGAHDVNGDELYRRAVTVVA